MGWDVSQLWQRGPAFCGSRWGGSRGQVDLTWGSASWALRLLFKESHLAPAPSALALQPRQGPLVLLGTG